MTKSTKIPSTLRQYELNDYRLQQVNVRLRLQDGPAYYSNHPIDNVHDAVDILKDVLKELDREWVIVVNLDTKLKPVNFSIVSIGSLCESIAPIQNILKSAILSNTNDVLMMHCHPSGSLEPSDPDIQVTRRLIEACKLMDMTLVDHIIVAGMTGDTYSFRKNFSSMFESMDIDLHYIDHMINGAA